MRRRGGTTLVEVLVAIFIMAIGLMTLLTLFPLGALSMAQAIKDTRAAHATANAAALAESMDIRHDNTAQNALDHPPATLPPLNADGPSYPVYVDPIGNIVNPGTPLGQIPRVTPGFTSNPNPPLQTALAYRWFSHLDDMDFHKDDNILPDGTVVWLSGTPVKDPSDHIQREGRYSWAYLVKRPRNADKALVELTVVVYSGRSPQSLGERPIGPVVLSAGSNFVDVPGKPDIRKGNWILDATMQVNAATPDPHGHFYRVVGVTDQGATTRLELDSNIKKGSTNGSLIIMESVVEVFEKGTGWQP